jgi:Cu/Ag efflux pump CusA
MHGISVMQIADTLKLALDGRQVGLLHQPREREDVPVILRLPLADRADIQRLQGIKMPRPEATWCPWGRWCRYAKAPATRASTTRT